MGHGDTKEGKRNYLQRLIQKKPKKKTVEPSGDKPDASSTGDLVQDQGAVGEACVATTKEVKITSGDLVPRVNKELKYLGLKNSLSVDWTVELTGEAYENSEKNELFETDVRIMAGHITDELVERLTTALKKINDNIQKNIDYRAGIAIPSQEDVQTMVAKLCEMWGHECRKELEQDILEYMRSNKAIKKQYRRYQIRCVHSVAMNVVAIVGGIATTAASWGATSPVSVVAILRSCAGLGIDIFHMTLDAGQTVTMIEKHFNVLKHIMDTKHDDKTTVYLNTAKEAGIGALAGILNIKLPSVAAVKEDINLLHNKVAGLHVKRQDYGKKLAEITEKIKAYEARIAECQEPGKEISEAQLKKHHAYAKEFEQQHQKLTGKAEILFKYIFDVVQRITEFEGQLKAYEANQKTWAQGAKPVFGFVTSLGLAGGGGSDVVGSTLGAFTEVVAFVDGRVWDEV